MKKIVLLVVLAALCQGVLVFSQSTPKYTESEYYYFNIPIEKIYVYRHGYVVLYRKGVNQMARTFLPTQWFVDVSGVGEIVGLTSGKEWPSMSVYYHNGEFSHVRLRIRRDRGHESWGIVPLNVNLDEHFDGIEEVKLEF